MRVNGPVRSTECRWRRGPSAGSCWLRTEARCRTGSWSGSPRGPGRTSTGRRTPLDPLDLSQPPSKASSPRPWWTRHRALLTEASSGKGDEQYFLLHRRLKKVVIPFQTLHRWWLPNSWFSVTQDTCECLVTGMCSDRGWPVGGASLFGNGAV